MTTTNFQRNADWLTTCGKQPGNPGHVSVAIGVDIEETAEFLSCIRLNHERAQQVLERIAADLEWLGNKLKRGDYIAHIPAHLREQALDGLCDREVTGNGVAFLAQMDKDAADQAVLASNESKLNEDGTAVILDGGKVGKSARYVAPNLKPYV